MAASKPIEEGRCPHFLKVEGPKSLDTEKLLGSWINYYDEKTLTEDFECVSAHLKKLDTNVLQFMNANSLTKETRDYLLKMKDPDASQAYFINEGYKLHFAFPHNPSTSRIFEHSAPISLEQTAEDFIRYEQFLDTDYNNHLLGYSCFEIAEYRDKETARPINLREL